MADLDKKNVTCNKKVIEIVVINETLQLTTKQSRIVVQSNRVSLWGR